MVIDSLNLKLRQIVTFSTNVILDKMSSVKCWLLFGIFLDCSTRRKTTLPYKSGNFSLENVERVIYRKRWNFLVMHIIFIWYAMHIACTFTLGWPDLCPWLEVVPCLWVRVRSHCDIYICNSFCSINNIKGIFGVRFRNRPVWMGRLFKQNIFIEFGASQYDLVLVASVQFFMRQNNRVENDHFSWNLHIRSWKIWKISSEYKCVQHLRCWI